MRTKKHPVSLLRILIALFISLVLGILLYKTWDSDYGYSHRKYFLSNDVIYLDFNKLESISLEQAKNNYELNWWCRSDVSLPDFGNYFCADELKGWNNIPAMLVVFWFKNGKLNNVKIDVPYWHHSKLIQLIKKEYGEPIQKSYRMNYIKAAKKLGLLLLTNGKYEDDSDLAIESLGVWELETGAWLVTEIEAGSNIFSKNTVFWINSEDVKKIKSN